MNKYSYNNGTNRLYIYNDDEASPEDFSAYLVTPEFFLQKNSDEIITQIQDEHPVLMDFFKRHLNNIISDNYKDSIDPAEVQAYRVVRSIQLAAFINTTFEAAEALRMPFDSVHLNLRDY
jgi:hypothetical protein